MAELQSCKFRQGSAERLKKSGRSCTLIGSLMIELERVRPSVLVTGHDGSLASSAGR